ncbi:MAG: hypothetical protein OIF58_05215 [Cohaesibacter sp.]|nr:hypothetical protein [Cohaesibacter sp.]
MAYIFLTRDNFAFLKSQLRSQLSEIKSSHISEAIAACANFKTYAAFIAACKSNLQHKPHVVELAEKRFYARLHELGYADCSTVDIDAICRSPNLPEKMWVAFTSTDSNANNRWFAECQKRNIPNVCIHQRRKYVELRWDCISIDAECDNHVKGDRGSQLVSEMFEAFQKICKGTGNKALFEGSSFVGTVDNVSKEMAYALADQFFIMLYEPIKEQPLAA